MNKVDWLGSYHKPDSMGSYFTLTWNILEYTLVEDKKNIVYFDVEIHTHTISFQHMKILKIRISYKHIYPSFLPTAELPGRSLRSVVP